MKIRELLEQTIAPQPPGQGQPTQPTEGPPNTSNTPKTPQPTGTAPVATAGQTQTTAAPQAGQPATAPTPQGGVQTGQPMGSGAASNPAQTQQLQQTAKQTMTDLDKIAAQIAGLKQMQQRVQSTGI